MKMKIYTFAALASFTLFACVSPKQMRQAEARYGELNGAYAELQGKYRNLEEELNKSKNQISNLQTQKQSAEVLLNTTNTQLDYVKQTNNVVLNQLKDLSVVTGAQAESIRRSLENIGAKDLYIQDLQGSIARKDSLNMALVMNLKGVLGNIDDKDVNIKVDKGVVYVDISDKLLFKSGSYDVTERAKDVLGKVAKVLNAQPDIEFLVEGHTDSIPLIKGGGMIDNWDLSVKRATTVVRILQESYGMNPKRMTAAGRGEFVPLTDNTSPEGRAANRRTRIVIIPQLDQFFKLLERKK
jgi:chemotaxis protein MotB